MKIMQVDVDFGASSTGKIVQDLRDGLQKMGHEVIAVHGRGELSDVPGVYKIASTAEVAFHAGMTRLTGFTGGYSPLATRRLKSIVDDFQPDVVHLHELHGYYVNIEETLEFLREREVPIVWTFHCEFMYTGKCGQSHECDKWKSGCHHCPQLRVYPSSLFFDFTRQMYENKRAALAAISDMRIVTPSKWMAKRIGESFLSGRRVDVIYNGLDTTNIFYPRDATAARAKLGISSRRVVVSIAPNLMTPAKGGHWILELARRMPNADVTFVMVGVDEGFVSGAPNVIALPRTRDQEFLAEVYSAGDVFLLTSEKESASLVTAESLACGTPAVGFDSGGPLEVAPDGYGHWVDYGDIDELERVLMGVLNGTIGTKTREECREFSVNRYSRQRMVTEYLDVYQEMAR